MTLELAGAVVFHRAQRGMSQRELAAAAGVSPQYLNDIERGRRTVSDATLERLATALRIQPAYLYWLSGKLPPDIERLLSEHTVAKALAAIKHVIEEEQA